jgi:hypothetical protein
MALHLNPKTEALINDMLAASDFTDADAMIEEALVLLEERLLHLRELVGVGAEDVAQGRVREFTPERRERLWQDALLQGETAETRG